MGDGFDDAAVREGVARLLGPRPDDARAQRMAIRRAADMLAEREDDEAIIIRAVLVNEYWWDSLAEWLPAMLDIVREGADSDDRADWTRKALARRAANGGWGKAGVGLRRTDLRGLRCNER